MIKDLDIVGWKAWLRFIWNAHITNWLWSNSQTRRLKRQKHYTLMKDSYFEKYLTFVKTLHEDDTIDRNTNSKKEPIFSLWLQGEDKAPEIVKRCLSILRKKYGDRVVVLDEETMKDYITLPEFIMKKWNNKQIIPANFSDIVRIELLTQYGGYWFDATDLLIAPIPEIIEKADFFMYVTSPTLYTHMFVQSCFIRAKKGDPLMKMWRELVWEYWRTEKRSADYFLVHMLFKLLVTHNKEAKELFDQMPKLYQDNLHLLWYTYGFKTYKPEYLEEMSKHTFFQKCSYRKLKHCVTEIIPGSTTDVLSKGVE